MLPTEKQNLDLNLRSTCETKMSSACQHQFFLSQRTFLRVISLIKQLKKPTIADF